MSRIHLLLADEHRPLLSHGADQALLDRAAAVEAERRKKVNHLFDEDQTNDLAAQRWAVIYPRDRPELLDWIGPLLRLREAQQRAPALRLPLGPLDDGRELARQLYDGALKPADQPRYLLILGDLDEIGLAVQLRLASLGAVGRLALDRAEDYRSYAEKAVAWDGRTLSGPPRTLLYGAYDPIDGAMVAGEQDLLAPVAEGAGPTALSFGRRDQSAVDGLRALLQTAAEETPSVLLTVSHGLGSSRWAPEERRARQGALRVGSGVVLEAEQLRDRDFLPGGLWAFFACFGAGTPSRSRYASWLEELVSAGALDEAPDVLRTLASDRPFVSAITRAALANPRGPLGVLGHVDLAWGWSFRDEAAGGESRAQRFASVLTSARAGDRFGLSLGPLARVHRKTGDDLLDLVELEREGGLKPEDRARRGHQWMTWHDLGSWVLLGDPAARLPVPQAAAVDPFAPLYSTAPSPVAQAAPASAPGVDLETLESLVLAKLAGEPDVRGRAEAQGIPWPQLRRFEQSYTEAGRRALALMLGQGDQGSKG